MDIPKDSAHRREWIKYQLRLKGISLSAIARELGVSRHAPRIALVTPYPRMERAIAAKIGVPPEILWPERYDTKKAAPGQTEGAETLSTHVDKDERIA